MKHVLKILVVLFLFAVVNINSAHCKANDVSSILVSTIQEFASPENPLPEHRFFKSKTAAAMSTSSVNFGLENTSDRVRITITSEAAGYTHFHWEVYDTSNNIKSSGSSSIEGSRNETYIAQHADLPIVKIIWEDEEED